MSELIRRGNALINIEQHMTGQCRRPVRYMLLSAAAMSGVMSTSAAHAQTGEIAEESPEIVVTALKRATNLQDTPIAISAITGEAIANAGVQSIADLGASTPSLSFVDGGPAQRRVVIRGIQGPGEPMIGTYYDETPVTGVIGSNNDAGATTPELRLFDVERVEVLRGPQGTLYGSGSMGGTLRVIYQKPVLTRAEGKVDVSLSNTNEGGWNYEGSAMVNVPVVNDRIAVRAVGFYRKQNGFIDNQTLGISNINDQKSYGGRVLARLAPNERWTVDLAAHVSRIRSDTPTWTLEAGKYIANAFTRQPIRDNTELYSVTSVYDLDFATLTASGSYMHRKLALSYDVSRFIRSQRTAGRCAALIAGGAACSATQLSDFFALVDNQSTSALFPQQSMEAWTAEVRMSSSGKGPLNWTIGGFYSDRDINVANPQMLANPTTGQSQPQQIVTVRFIEDSLSQVAGFGELSWEITDRFNLTGGARYFHYSKDILGTTTVPSILIGARLTPPTKADSSESGWALRGNASYKISSDVMLYAEAAQGFRPGGANQVLGLDAALTGYDSDSLWNYEVGIKASLFDRRMTLNVDVFQIDWSDMQVTLRTPNGAFSYIGNAGNARVRGLEAEGSIRPWRGFSLMGNASYVIAKLTENQNTGIAPTSGLRGDRIPYVPRLMAGTSAQYSWPLSDSLSGFVRLDANYLGSSWTEFRHNYVFARRIDDYALANARIGVEASDNRWGAYLFVTNLFNSTAITTKQASAIFQRTLATSAMPRTIGINLRVGF